MRRWIVGLVVLASLGCSGAGEKLFEITTGGTMEITEDGMVMTMPDGTKVTSVAGDGAVMPEAFPLPPPWEGARPQALTRNVRPDGTETVMLSYPLERPKAEILDRYRQAMEALGGAPTHEQESALGTHTDVLKANLADGREVSVVISEAYGANTVTVALGPLDGR